MCDRCEFYAGSERDLIMAIIRHVYCTLCEDVKLHLNNECQVCAERKERERVAVWNALTVEEKMQDLRRRIEVLERGPARY